MNNLKISFFQLCPKYNSLSFNLEEVKNVLYDNRERVNNSDIVVFPEYFLSGSLCLPEILDYIDQFVKINVLAELNSISTKYPDTCFVFGSLLIPKTHLNTSIAIKNGKTLAKYSKKALVYNENYLCHRDKEYPVFEIKNIKIGLAICWDITVPELFRNYTSKADLVIIPALWGLNGNHLHTKYDFSLEEKYYKSLLMARAYENDLAIVFVNSYGQYKSTFYTDTMMGNSTVIMPPLGDIYNTNTQDSKLVHTVDMDFSHLERYKKAYNIGSSYNYYKSNNII